MAHHLPHRQGRQDRAGAGASLFVACCLAAWIPAHAGITGFGSAGADGTLRIGGQVVRLYGIYVPPTGQACLDFVRPAICGTRASAALQFKIGGEFIHCAELGIHPDNSVTARCMLGNEDLGAWMLLQGWAAALPDAPYEYTVMERMARARGIGIWGIPVDTFRPRGR